MVMIIITITMSSKLACYALIYHGAAPLLLLLAGYKCSYVSKYYVRISGLTHLTKLITFLLCSKVAN